MLWIGVAVSAVAVAMVAFSGGAAGPLWSGAVLALFATSALLAAGRRPFGAGRPRWIEMDAIPGGRRLTPDARVHFFTERRPGLPMLVLSSIWTLVFGSGAIIGVAIGANGRPQALIGALVLAVVAVLFGYAVVRAVRVRVRDGALGRRAAGLAIGRDGVTILRPEMTVHLPWSSIRAVESDTTYSRWAMPQTPLIRLRIAPDGAVSADARRVPSTITVQPAQLDAHPRVVWSALRVFHRSPEERAILCTSQGQDLLEAWSASVPSD